MLLRGDSDQESTEHDRKQTTASVQRKNGINLSNAENVNGMKFKEGQKRNKNVC